jgi:hypothetical protein
MEYADLELGLHRRAEGRYGVELRFSQPDSDADIRLTGEEVIVEFDPAALDAEQSDPLDYGQALTQRLFAAPPLQAAFLKARAAADSLDIPLRLRLFVGPSAPELHTLRWETLRDPAEDRPLLTDERLFFSRYLSVSDWRPVRLRPRAALRALVVIANPGNLGEYKREPVDVAGELERARQGLGNIPVTALAEPGSATLDGIAARLREGYDILYLVGHGAMIRGEPWIWLEDQQNRVARVAGADLALRIRELEQRPRLIVLASCQSAGTGPLSTEGALAPLGPRLAEAGVPAVLAMQGNISMTTVETFMPVFFGELQRDGQIDRALAVARGAVRDRHDSWIPVLFMRLKSGRIWYVPGFGDDRQAFEKWPALIRSIKRGQCTPIVGAGVAETALGLPREIARGWAESYNYPLAAHQRDELPEVAQYLSVNQDPQFPRDELVESLRREMVRRHAGDLAEGAEQADVYDLLAVVGELLRERDPADPYKVLAEQPFPIDITTVQPNLLSEALRAANKDPQVEFCRWNETIADLPSIFEDDPDYRPTPERPLVFHLFGILDEADSLVLTEDDHFDYLISISRNPELIPLPVREALADTALLFLGFRLSDWDFRVLYRSLTSQEGRNRRRKYAHIAGQVMPDEEYFLMPERARRYFESYFQDSDISIFWGSVEDFTRELQQQLLAAETDRGPRKPEVDRASLRRR